MTDVASETLDSVNMELNIQYHNLKIVILKVYWFHEIYEKSSLHNNSA